MDTRDVCKTRCEHGRIINTQQNASLSGGFWSDSGVSSLHALTGKSQTMLTKSYILTRPRNFAVLTFP